MLLDGSLLSIRHFYICWIPDNKRSGFFVSLPLLLLLLLFKVLLFLFFVITFNSFYFLIFFHWLFTTILDQICYFISFVLNLICKIIFPVFLHFLVKLIKGNRLRKIRVHKIDILNFITMMIHLQHRCSKKFVRVE